MPIKQEEVQFSLPTNWEWTRLSIIGLTNPRNNIEDSQLTSFIPMNLIPQSYGEVIKSEVREWGDIKKGFTHFAEGDVVLAKITPCFQNGKAAVMRGLHNKVGAGTTELHVFRPLNNLVCSQYVLIYLKSPNFVNSGVSKLTGTAGQKRVPNDYFAENPFPLPPIAEQKRIVAKVDELMALCDRLSSRQQQKRSTRIIINNAAIGQLLTAREPEVFNKSWQHICNNFDLLYSTPENIGKLRQAILQLAVQGKLVPQNDFDEPASVLLEKIKFEKERLVKEGKIKKEKLLPAINIEQIPYEIPQGWKWIQLGEIAKTIEYGTSEKSSDIVDEVPVFRMNNIRDGKVLFNNLKYVPTSIKDLPRLYLQDKDILFNRTNSYELVGKTGVFTGVSDRYTFASYLIRIKLFLNYINPELINITMNSAYFRQTQIEPEITQQCGQANFNGTKLKNAVIPLPPLAEQHRIVAKVNQLMSLCDELETKLTQSVTNSEKLMEAAVRQILAANSNKIDIHESTVIESIPAETTKPETKTAGRRNKKTQGQDTEAVQLNLPLF